jgi:hypothetical protein
MILLATTAALVVACSDKAASPGANSTGAPAASPSANATTAASPRTPPRSLPLNVQGVATAGVTVRVKGIEMGEDATVLKVSMSFSSRIASSTNMALIDTLLEDDKGNRLMLKRPENNRELTIRDGDTMEGDLVFLGSVSPSATSLKLVFNERNQPDNIAGPGLVMVLALARS